MSEEITSNGQILTDLLPSTAYILVYSLPLLFVSIILTFAGAFLIFDRTRSFPPTSSYNDILTNSREHSRFKLHWILEGGVGGLASGYAFGVHLSTFLAMLIPSTTSLSPLTPKSFLAVWFLSALTTTILAGRWQYATLFFSGVSGGATLALSLCVITHPSLLTRIVVICIFVTLISAFTILPISRTQHGFLRLAASSSGAFGIVVCVALLKHVFAWENVWQRLWMSNNIEWGTAQEKGLSAAFCFLLVGGTACDWALKRRFGENPDQKWDNYLANYTASLPNPSGEGIFRPLSSFWARLFHRNASPPIPNIIRFPEDEDNKFPFDSAMKPTRSLTDHLLPAHSPLTAYDYQPSPTFLRKATKTRFQARGGRQRREVVKFRPMGSNGDDDSESDSDLDDLQKPTSPPFEGRVQNQKRRLTKEPSVSSAAFSGSGTTLTNGIDDRFGKVTNESGAEGIDIEQEHIRLARIKGGIGAGTEQAVPEYSDHEEDVTSLITRPVPSRGGPGWKPQFMQRHHESGSGYTLTTSQGTSANVVSSLPGTVPVTPSLIQALDRIAVAQQAAFGPLQESAHTPRSGLPTSKSSEPGLNEGLPRPQQESAQEDKNARWEQFWRDVKEKASQK